MNERVPIFDQVVVQALSLPPVQKAQLVERLMKALQGEMAASAVQPSPRRSLYGVLSDLGSAPTEEEIDENRRDMWKDSRVKKRTFLEAASFQEGETERVCPMPRRTVQYIKGGHYHIYNRGAGRQSIFRQDENYLYLLRLLKQVTVDCEVTIIAYCLLPNHYHWLVRQDGDLSAGKVPARVFGSYSQAFNRAYERSGTLFEGPYKAVPVERDEYLRHLCLYIHANPVRHGLAASPELWPYSNYLEWLGERNGTLLDPSFVRIHFVSSQHYAAAVSAYLMGQTRLPEALGRYLAGLE